MDKRLEDMRIGVVGRGRLGPALAVALATAGLDVEGPFGRGAECADCDVVLLCVPDSAIAEAARAIRPGRLVGHCSGATPLEPLAPHEAFSLHPLMTVTAAGALLEGATCTISGSTRRAVNVAAGLAGALGMDPVVVADADRDLYHAAASLAANYLVTLEGAAEQLFARVGVDREHAAPLVRAAVDNWAKLGAERALTGPVVRGDDTTVARQRAAIAERGPELLPLWDALTAATIELAARTHVG